MFDVENKENTEPLLNDTDNDNTKSYVDQKLGEYRRNIEEFEGLIDRIQYETETIRKENARKDQCIRTCLEEKEGDKRIIVQHVKAIKELEQELRESCEELHAAKQKSQLNAIHFSTGERKINQLLKKYENAKSTIEDSIKNEEQLHKSLEETQHKIVILNKEYASLNEKYNRELEQTQEQVGQENEETKREIAKLQSVLKRLEIRTTSLEDALKQKSEECIALSALYDDIAGRRSC